MRHTRTPYGKAQRPDLPDPGSVFEHLLPDLQEYSNGFAWACCPFHDDRNPSLCVNLTSGWYKCQSSHCGAHGSSIVSFVGALYGFDYQEARKYLEEHYD